ncbi:hypothetical protein [Flavobacterium cheniae]|uniref:Uncharacterized protein n=1 Tax=Flavobacterium cheniae TaxID=295428 RepID=A0A562K8P8_9FLAO|nr:hypothetical protein [Flavobacterium cheniae]TDR25343.1 hypothetical protein C8D80_0113 [Flavobacterium cheniae]TWH91756.1 hypothetical protein IP97_02569 [Flavobacterium cheniae]
MKKLFFLSLLAFLSFGVTKGELKFDNYDVFQQKHKFEEIYVFVKLTGNANESIKKSVLENLMNTKSKTKNVKFAFSEKDIINSNYTLEINLDSVTISPEKIDTKEHVYNSAIREEQSTLISRIESYEQNYVYTGQIQGRITVFSKSKSSQIIATVKLLKNDILVKTDVVKGEYYFFHNYVKKEGNFPHEFEQRYPYSSKDKNFINDNEMIEKTIKDLNKKLKKSIKSINFNLV